MYCIRASVPNMRRSPFCLSMGYLLRRWDNNSVDVRRPQIDFDDLDDISMPELPESPPLRRWTTFHHIGPAYCDPNCEAVVTPDDSAIMTGKFCPNCMSYLWKSIEEDNFVRCKECEAEFCWLCMRLVGMLHFYILSGCTIKAQMPWSRAKVWRYRILLYAASPFVLVTAVVVSIPFCMLYCPIWARENFQERNPCTQITAMSVGLLISPVIGVLVVIFGVPIFLAYLFFMLPIEWFHCRDCRQQFKDNLFHYPHIQEPFLQIADDGDDIEEVAEQGQCFFNKANYFDPVNVCAADYQGVIIEEITCDADSLSTVGGHAGAQFIVEALVQRNAEENLAEDTSNAVSTRGGLNINIQKINNLEDAGYQGLVIEEITHDNNDNDFKAIASDSATGQLVMETTDVAVGAGDVVDQQMVKAEAQDKTEAIVQDEGDNQVTIVADISGSFCKVAEEAVVMFIADDSEKQRTSTVEDQDELKAIAEEDSDTDTIVGEVTGGIFKVAEQASIVFISENLHEDDGDMSKAAVLQIDSALQQTTNMKDLSSIVVLPGENIVKYRCPNNDESIDEDARFN